MRLLLDTHVLLWWLRDSPLLSPRARAVIADPNVEVLVSVASGWELSVKYRLGKIDEPGTSVLREAGEEGFRLLAVALEHLAALETLPRVSDHGDPFDQLLLSQALVEDALLMTGDRPMTGYGVRCIGVA